MKLLSLLLLLISPAAFAGNGSGNVSNVAGVGAISSPSAPSTYFAIPSGSQVFSLYFGDWAANAVSGDYYPLFKDGTAYRVTSGKTAICFDIVAFAGAAAQFQLVSDTAAISVAQAGALTSGKYQAGAATKYIDNVISANTMTLIPGTFQFGSLTYAGFQIGTAAGFTLRMNCYEY